MKSFGEYLEQNDVAAPAVNQSQIQTQNVGGYGYTPVEVQPRQQSNTGQYDVLIMQMENQHKALSSLYQLITTSKLPLAPLAMQSLQENMRQVLAGLDALGRAKGIMLNLRHK